MELKSVKNVFIYLHNKWYLESMGYLDLNQVKNIINLIIYFNISY